MNCKPIILRAVAMRDIDNAIAFLLEQGAEVATQTFVAELELASRVISENPGMGSPRHGHELNLPGLRSWPLTSQPYLVFYVDRDDHLDVWRVLHMHQDIPAAMAAPPAHP